MKFTILVFAAFLALNASGRPSSDSAVEQSTRHEACFQAKDTGPCRGAFTKWYFDGKQNKCYRFVYGGCQGNDNQFESEENCLDYCYLNNTNPPSNMSLVAQAFETSRIVPDVIPTPPTANIELKYPSGVHASQGNELTPTQVKEQPSVSFKADENAYYTLIFLDPDNYDGPEEVYREWHHWLVTNIPGGNVSEGEVLSGYIGSGPPEGTGIHRYVYIVYKQPGKLEFDEKRLTNKSVDGRDGFSSQMFAQKYNLGSPVAGNFYRAQFDDYVPKLYKSLGVSL